MNDKWISTDEAARITGYDKEWVRRLARENKIVSQKFGHAVMISEDSIKEYRQTHGNG